MNEPSIFLACPAHKENFEALLFLQLLAYNVEATGQGIRQRSSALHLTHAIAMQPLRCICKHPPCRIERCCPRGAFATNWPGMSASSAFAVKCLATGQESADFFRTFLIYFFRISNYFCARTLGSYPKENYFGNPIFAKPVAEVYWRSLYEHM